jgi:hypothetical protein
MYLTSFIDNWADELSSTHPAPLYVGTSIYIKAYTSTDKPRAWAAPYTPGVLILDSERLVKLVAAKGELSELIYERTTILLKHLQLKRVLAPERADMAAHCHDEHTDV